MELPGDSDLEDGDDDDATMTGMMAGAALRETEGEDRAQQGQGHWVERPAEEDGDYVVLSSAVTPTNANP